MKKITLIFIVFFGVMASMNAQNTEPKTYFVDHFIGGLADDGDIIWVGVDNSLVKMDKVTGETIASYTIPISNEYNYTERYAASISLNNNGMVWITSPNGVGGFGLEGNYLLTFSPETNWEEIPWYLVYAHLIIDKEDKVWVSEILGLHEYDGTGSWIDHIIRSGEWPYGITTLAVDSQNYKWLGLTNTGCYLPSCTGLLVKLDGTPVNVRTSPYLNGSGTIWSMNVSPNGIVWMGTQGNGLVKFDGINWEVYNWSNSGLPNNSVRNVTVEGANIIWLSTANQLTSIANGLTRFDGDTWKTFNTDNSILPSNTINSILVDENGTKWVGTDKGLISFAGNALSTSEIQSSGFQFILFPNPVQNFITLKTSSNLKGSTVTIYNILGKVLKTFKTDHNNNNIDVSDLANGMYLLRLQTIDGIAIKKFVKRN